MQLWQDLKLFAFLAVVLTSLDSIRPAAAQVSVSNVVNTTDFFFQAWHGSPPGGCVPGDTSRPNAISPEVQICPSPGGFITGLELLNGTYGFPGLWQVTAVCSDGTRLATIPSSITGRVENPFLTKLSFPLGFAVVSGRSGNWVDQLLGVPGPSNGGGAWQDNCPNGSLVSGLQAWVTYGPAAPCVAGGMRFQCNGSYAPILAIPGYESIPRTNFQYGDIPQPTTACGGYGTIQPNVTSCAALCTVAANPPCVAFNYRADADYAQCCYLKSVINQPGQPCNGCSFYSRKEGGIVGYEFQANTDRFGGDLNQVNYSSVCGFSGAPFIGSVQPSAYACAVLCSEMSGPAPCVGFTYHGTAGLPTPNCCYLKGSLGVLSSGPGNDFYLRQSELQAYSLSSYTASPGNDLPQVPGNSSCPIAGGTGFGSYQSVAAGCASLCSSFPGKGCVGFLYDARASHCCYLKGAAGNATTLYGTTTSDLYLLVTGTSRPTAPPYTNPSSPFPPPAPIAPSTPPTTVAPPSSPLPAPPPSTEKSSSSGVPIIAASLAGVGVLALLCAIILGCCLVRRRRKRGAGFAAPMLGAPPPAKGEGYFVPGTSSTEQDVGKTVLSGLEGQFRSFDWSDLSRATDNFHQSTIVGEGAFGRVYRGMLGSGRVVAIKQLKGEIKAQQQAEFLSELRVLSRVRHRSLVALHGFSTAQGNLFLVLDFAKNGSLDAALRQGPHLLSWETRLNIAIGAARGLSYLHNDMRPVIIHRDIKASNILLDENMEAQVADFGMAKLAGDDVNRSFLTNSVRGTLGYVAPEYAQLGRVTPKCDVYSFGVLLMELVTASRAVMVSSSGEVASLVERVASSRKLGAAALLDPRLQGAAPLDQVDRVVAIASACVQEEEALRPTMSDVLRSLENVLEGIVFLGVGPPASYGSGRSNPSSPLGGKGDLEVNSWQSSDQASSSFGYEMTKIHVGR